MQIIRKLEHIPNLVLALGFFDGVHSGHKKVIESAVRYAQKYNLKSSVITFKEHPLCVLNNIKPQYILSKKDDYKIIETLGIDYIIELDFSEFAKMTANQYLENIIVKYFSPAAIFTGFNHNFGLNRQGNTAMLQNFQSKYGYKYFRIDAQSVDNRVISSTAVRTALKSGQIELANKMLGFKFFVEGIVIQGQKIGRTIGFPTINLNFPDNIIELPNGVYEVNVDLCAHNYKGIANFGSKPTVSNKSDKLLEIHIFNFNKDVYGQTAKISFVKMLRAEKKFSDLAELQKQIRFDIAQIT